MEGTSIAEGALPDAVVVVDYGEGKGDGIQVPPTPSIPKITTHVTSV